MHRVLVTFWILVILTIVTSGILARALASPPSTATGMTVAVAGLLAAASGTLALRVLVVVTRQRQKTRLTP